jgi:drug/metabolite transporter (DMT)-like permease
MKKLAANNLGYLYAIFAAILFGASTPAAKFLTGKVEPWLLAGLLYLGSAVGLMVIRAGQIFSKKHSSTEASLRGKDWGWLSGSVFLGGIIGPVLLLIGLSEVSAATGSLLLNTESLFTALIAWLIFKEQTDKKIILGMILIVIGCCVLGWKNNFALTNLVGPIAIILACLCWAIDNNLTQKISAANPVQIAMIKCLIAGITNTILALCDGAKLPGISLLISAGVIGVFGYGVSLMLFILGLRHIGTARTGAYFSLAPFVGVAVAILFLGEPVSMQLIFAAIFMGMGIWLHLTEYHIHEHEHEELEHEHLHFHDSHHQHEHSPNDPPGEPHCHWHRHKPIRHSHPHYPDIHHRHQH